MDQLVTLAVAGDVDSDIRPKLFTSAWWLDAASAGKIETVRAVWDGVTVGELSFLRHRRLGMTCLRMPAYTRTLGPVLTPPPSKPIQRCANIRRIVNELVERLPRHDEFGTTLDPQAEAAIPFAFDVAGYHVCQAFTFRTQPSQAIDDIWSGLDKRTRNVIRSAGRRMTVMESSSFDRFERMSRQERQAEGTTHDYTILRRLYEAASARGQALLRFAVQDDGTDAAALILVWDDEVMYYWTSARNREATVGGGNALLLWESIRLANVRGVIFDFDGYCSRGAARFLAGFAWEPVVRPVVNSYSVRYRLARLGQEVLRRGRDRTTLATSGDRDV
jgi:hypothetical protein